MAIIYRRVMKALMVLIGILLIAFTPTAQTPQSNTQDSASLEDTLKWIQSKVSSYSSVKDKNSGDIDKTEDITYSGCKIDLQLSSRHNESSGHIFKALRNYSFSLKDAERADAIPDRNGVTNVALGFKLKIHGTTEYYLDTELRDKEKEPTEAIFLPFDDKDMAQRVANAFQHALKLCGGGKVKEVF